ncbi:MAG: 50S ribosomal protein L23 [Elusimicrobiales bacterium]|jgi:large subunit ribosomal protein L23|nr:50S ribosomal protein L23 [Elusimicrobiales bacterium]
MHSTEVLISPILSEKSVNLKDTQNCYCFKVNVKANKTEIKRAVEEMFKVKVTDVRTSIVSGKVHRVGRFEGYRGDWKKAMVTVKEGQKIDVASLPK